MSDKRLQYQDYGGVFIRCGDTTRKLDPGFYEAQETRMGWGLTPKSLVSDDLIDIPGTIADDIFADVDQFLGSADRYQAYGLTHKRGYLFYGPPGSGKTSLAMMIARRFIQNVGGIVVYASAPSELVASIAIIGELEPGRPSMYLLEEADRFVNTTSCLSILDGELSIRSSVFVAMTNYKKNLPPRIANRPGRFDRVEQVACPPEQVQLEYLRRIEAREEGGPRVAEAIVAALSGLPVSIAHLREAFISHVLMGINTDEIRERFAKMCSTRMERENAEADEEDGVPKAEFVHDDGDEPYDDSEDLSEDVSSALKMLRKMPSPKAST